jgi:hypothetical protein
MSTQTQVRVTVRFYGRLSGALGIGSEHVERRTITVPSPFTEEEAKEAARVNLYDRQGDSLAYEHVTVKSIAFN